MRVELRLRGAAERLVAVVFEEYEVALDGSDTIVHGEARDEIAAIGLIERARHVGFTVVSWRNLDEQPPVS
jgi:hypothetical protein